MEGENEIKKGEEKKKTLKSIGHSQIMQKYREQTERLSRENTRGYGIRRRNKLKIKTHKPSEGERGLRG